MQDIVVTWDLGELPNWRASESQAGQAALTERLADWELTHPRLFRSGQHLVLVAKGAAPVADLPGLLAACLPGLAGTATGQVAEALTTAKDGPDRGFARAPILDSHHHFWQIDRGDYGWLTPDLGVLYRDYGPEDLAPSLARAGVTRTILVQAAETEAETDFLLALAESCDFVAGVCGWLDMDSDGFPQRLAHYLANPWFVSLRPMLQDLPEPGWILRPRVLRNLAHLAAAGCRFEILTKPPQLPYAVEAVKRTPGLWAVVNHLSKPDIAAGDYGPWASQIAELANYPQIFCKLSGMVTEAGALWTADDLRPYIAHILRTFGPDRVMFGSDWPVALLAADSYGEIVNTLRTVLGPDLDHAAHRRLFHDNAARFYRLPDPVAPQTHRSAPA